MFIKFEHFSPRFADAKTFQTDQRPMIIYYACVNL